MCVFFSRIIVPRSLDLIHLMYVYLSTLSIHPSIHQAFNFTALILSNASIQGILTFKALTYGAHLLERIRWTECMAHARQLSLFITIILYAISLLRHGMLPAFFTLLVVFNGLSISKFILWYVCTRRSPFLHDKPY